MGGRGACHNVTSSSTSGVGFCLRYYLRHLSDRQYFGGEVSLRSYLRRVYLRGQALRGEGAPQAVH